MYYRQVSAFFSIAVGSVLCACGSSELENKGSLPLSFYPSKQQNLVSNQSGAYVPSSRLIGDWSSAQAVICSMYPKSYTYQPIRYPLLLSYKALNLETLPSLCKPSEGREELINLHLSDLCCFFSVSKGTVPAQS